jgi:type IX secretion system PorP/SprF family membrane protein
MKAVSDSHVLFKGFQGINGLAHSQPAGNTPICLPSSSIKGNNICGILKSFFTAVVRSLNEPKPYRLATGLWLLIAQNQAVAQYIPNSNQGYQLAAAYNPSFSGIEPYGDLKFGYRYQWAGWGEDAPKFINLAYNFRINQPADLARNALRTSVPLESAKAVARQLIFQGMGINLFNESMGAIVRTGGGVSYSFHYPVSRKKNITLSSGLGAMVENVRLNMDKIYLGMYPDPDPLYDDMLYNVPSRTDLNLRAGALVYSPNFFVGFCYLPLLLADLNGFATAFNVHPYLGTFQAGISFSVGPVIELKPSVLGILWMNRSAQIDYNLKVVMRQKASVGITYRSTESFVGLIGFRMTDIFSASYTYEVSFNRFRQYNDGSHELVLGIRFNNFGNHNSNVW